MSKPNPKMTMERAQAVREALRKLCFEHGIHFAVKEVYNPDLAYIVFEEVSIKVSK